MLLLEERALGVRDLSASCLSLAVLGAFDLLSKVDKPWVQLMVCKYGCPNPWGRIKAPVRKFVLFKHYHNVFYVSRDGHFKSIRDGALTSILLDPYCLKPTFVNVSVNLTLRSLSILFLINLGIGTIFTVSLVLFWVLVFVLQDLL